MESSLDQRDVQIALRIFDHLRSFGHANRFRLGNPLHNDRTVERGDALEGLRRRLSRDDLANISRRNGVLVPPGLIRSGL